MDRYLCIHGHFYQPPRENPWLESIELQDSAYPFHDWNERITAECYGPNAASRILDGEGRIAKIVNNYSKISFNFGPTLLAWMEARDPELYEAILEADRESQKRYSGHGSAIAQCFNHLIMPLASERDKVTQVRWGLRDFEFRFRRRAEGIWLPETAVDLETLHVLAEEGIKFTILAQYQARRIRGKANRKWVDVVGGHVDPTMPYEIQLKSGKSLTLFFYDGPISRGIAFERLLMRGEDFAGRLLSAFSTERTWPQLVHIATDGETYGHHHPHGDMALAYTLDYIERNKLARLTNYGEYLEKNPPTHQVEIIENTAWSCAHGIDRWRANCGCNSGGQPGWNQSWRAPLRAALDWLRDAVVSPYQETAAEYLTDPWQARDDYVSVVLNRWPDSIRRFFRRNARRDLTPDDEIVVLKLLELQRHAMLMYTSCGWFFDELTGIETVQVIQYAGRVVQLAHELFGQDFEPGFLERLERARSNIAEHRDGKAIYLKWVKPTIVDLTKVAAHYAASTLFDNYGDEAIVYCYQIDRQNYRLLESGRARLAVGRVKIASRVTQEATELSFACLHLGDHNLACGVQRFKGMEDYSAMVKEVTGSFERADFPETIRRIDRRFREATYSLKSLFRDEQRKILDQILQDTLVGAEGVYRQLYQNQTPLMRFLGDLGVPLPAAFKTAAEVILNNDLRRALTEDEPDLGRIQSLLEQVAVWKVQLDTAGLGYTFGQLVEHVTHEFEEEPQNVPRMLRLEAIIDLAHSLPFKVDLSMPENVYYKLLNGVYRNSQRSAAQGDEGARFWVHQFQDLGRKLSIRVAP